MAELKNDEQTSINIDQVRLLEIDKAVKSWLTEEISPMINGRKVPVLFGSWERFAQMQGTKNDDGLDTLRDKNGMLKLPIISIRRSDVSPGQERYKKTSIDGQPYIKISKKIAHAKFDNKRVPFKKDGRAVYEIQKIPWPAFIDINYSATFWSSFIKHSNIIHSKIWANCKPYVNYNGFFFYSTVTSSSDESNLDDFTTEERIIKNNYSIEVQAYLIDTDKIITNRTVSQFTFGETILDNEEYANISEVYNF